ncbi:hypothetical protein HNQ91_002901 [Filimonas zeae]|uniref:Membrane protein n=1 Tax=Filimonas zeae TaxID=1737353 RepID=A0A917J081_9BACT|nr:RagB/SusD family nutrient uptake outer membrane protein [Filimonas zeae]MDR6339836.1 hypothetical protein [Filimonas zeae]GGH69882.1 membrane protein [Filimonas zeae]
MKKNILSIAVLLMAVCSSCSKQLDGIRPKDQIPQEALNSNDINTLRVGMYSQMENVLFTFWFDFDIKAGNLKGGPGFTMSSDYVNMSPSDAAIATMWQTAFLALNKINFLLETIDNNPQPASFATIKGEALYFRALVYYHLAARWGGMPLLTKRTYDVVQRSTEETTWDLIKADLTSAEKLVANYSDRFYVSTQAVQALAARVYLATKDNANAIAYADKVLSYTTSGFTLSADATAYASQFVAGSTARELIFALANNTAANPHLFYQQVNDIDGSWGYSPASDQYTTLFADNEAAAGDKRKAATFSADNNRIIKFPNGISGQQLVSTTSAAYTPIVVSRLAEIYLIKAEAQGAGSAAAATLAPYFAARYQTTPTAAYLTGLNATGLQSLLLNERRREFYAEGYWWYDIKRTNRTDLLPALNSRNYLLYYPIPQTELDLAGYTKNEGY